MTSWLPRGGFAALAALLIAGPPPAPGTQDRGPHTSVSNVSAALTTRESPVPERESPFDPRAIQGDNIRTIMGSTDDRSAVDPEMFPARAMVSIISDLETCSGWLYGSDVVATAGHCIHKKGRWASNVKVRSADSRDTSCGARMLFTSRGWTEDREQYDYGAIKLDCDMGADRGWFGVSWGQHAGEGTRARVIGYSLDANARFTLRSSVEPLANMAGGQLFYDNDTGTGTSGAPVIAIDACAACAIGVHTTGAHAGPAPHDRRNHGTLISRDVFENLRAWKALR